MIWYNITIVSLFIEGVYYEQKKQVNQKIVALYCRISLDDYTDKAKGILSEQCFMKLTTAMEQEQEEH